MTFDDFDRVLLPTTREDLIVRGADGAEVKVDDGTREKWVVDATSQVGTNPLGHRNEEMLAAMEELHTTDGAPLMIAGNDFYHEYQRELGEKFTEIFPGDQSSGDIKAYYCNSGSEAVERGCLKAAQLHQGGNTYVGFYNAFHGRTSLALSCNFSKAEQTEGFNSLFRALPVPYADRRFDCDDCISRLEETITREGPSNVNAVVVEPVQGEGGYVVPDDDFLPGVRRVTEEHNVPLVVDEVQASLRTGEWFACENWDVEPDMIAAAKAFSGGITPFGASLIKEGFATEEQGKHSSTFGGNPQDCFAALKTIEIIQENDYLANARRMGHHLETAWRDLEASDIVVEERGIGLMRGIEFKTVSARDHVLDRLLEEYDILATAVGNDQYNPSIRFL
ncbi:MAG: aspartate aminotransferase family protein, partial [Candidatus Nanohaloarchaea archaeon]